MSTNRLHRVGLVFCFVFSMAYYAKAQNSMGIIRGSITDSSGKFVPDAEVTINDTATHSLHKSATNDAGIYVFPAVPVGDYQVMASKAGFAPQTHSGIVIETTETVVVNFTLTVGSVAQEVTVSTAETTMNVSNAEVSSVVNEVQQTQLPLNTRSFSAFVALSPGSVPSNINTPVSAARSGLGAFVNGMRSFYNYFTLDGADISDPRFPGNEEGSGGGLGFSNDAIAEFRVVSQNGNAELGINMGPHIVMTSKRGTSELHGTAFEYFRNNAMDARDYFDPAKKPPFKQNQFGFDLGGPIPLDKNTFFFLNTEIRKQRRSISSVITVPTPTLLADVPDGPEHGNLRSLMELLFPAPPVGSFAAGAVTASFPATVLKNQDLYTADGRIDHHFGKAHDFSGRYIFYRAYEPFGSVVGTGIPSNDVNDFRMVHNFLLQDTWTISPTLVNQMLFAFNRLDLEFVPRPFPDSVKALGYSTDISAPNGVPQILFNGTGLNYIGAPISDPESDIDNVFQEGDKLSWSKGKHFLGFGVDVERNQDNTATPNNVRPQTIFVGFGAPFDTSTTGVTTGKFFTQTQNYFVDDSERGLRRATVGAYFTDTYQVRPSLTLTYGLRYEYAQPPSEVNDRVTNLYQVNADGKPLPDASITNINQVGLFTADEAGGLWKRNHKQFGPRIGLAWQADSKIVVRAGYSLAFGRLPFTNITQTRLNPPFVIPTLANNLPFGTSNAPSEGQIPVLNIVDPGFTNPYGEFYNLTVQAELNSKTTIQVGYVGSQGHHLDRIHVLNYGPGYTRPRINPALGPVYIVSSDSTSSYNSLQAQAQRRMSDGLTFQGSYTFSKCLDNSSGSTLVVGSGGDFLSNFPTNENDIGLNRGRCDFDFRNIGVGTLIYDLPFGRPLTGVAGKAFAGWSVDSIVMFRSGQGYSLFTGTDTNGDGIAADRASIVVPLSQLRCHGCNQTQWLDPAQRGTGVLNSTAAISGRNILSGPQFGNLDFALHKSTKIGDKIDIQLRGEFFNLFNTAHLDTPSNNLSASTYGRILDDVSSPRQVQLAMRFVF